MAVITGDVIAVESHWTADGSRIVTEAIVSTAAGPITVSQLGGTVGELTMRQWPAPEIMELGMRVIVDLHDAPDRRGVMHAVVDGVKVMSRSQSFVRTGPTKGNHSLYWESGCIYLSAAAEGTKDVSGDDEFPVIEKSAMEWDTKTASCSYMRTIMDPPSADTEVGHDGINLIKFRDSSWCRPEVDDDPARCYAHSAAGLTTAIFVDSTTNPRDGAIVDADVELNALDFDISVDGMTLGTAGCKADLQNTLTHELGHLHGLEHTCLADLDPPRTDDQGRPVPECTPNDPEIYEATMYNFQECGETKKQTLEQDDIDAICAIYPKANDPGSCARIVEDNPGCCGTSRHPGAALLMTGSVLAFLARRRRRR